MDGVDITFVVPCLNEERHVRKTIETIIDAADEAMLSYEILVYDDGSSDNTSEVVKIYQRQNPHLPVRLIRNENTLGLGRNYIEGAYTGKGKYYMLACGDNPHPKDYFVSLLKEIGTADMIIPVYERFEGRKLPRKLLSCAFRMIVNLLSGYRIRYYNGEVVHLRYNVMRWHPDTTGYAYQAEIICRLLDEGFSYREISSVGYESENSTTFTLHKILSVSHSLLQIFLRRVRKVSREIL